MDVSQAGLDLIKTSEGLRLKAYRDSGGVLTIGYGHTGPDVLDGLIWIEAQADAALLLDIRDAVAAVRALVKVPLKQGQFDALVDFVFNEGEEQFEHSTLLHYLNAGDYAGAATQFGRWIYDDGVVLKGLIKRRAAERDMFTGA